MIHQFDTDIAAKYGINAAIILNNIVFWIAKNEANEENFYDGRYWTYNSVHAFNILFPYLTAKQILLAIKTLCDEEVIIKGNYNKDKYDRTTWYALSEKGKSILRTGQMDLTCRANGFDVQGKPIPDINQIINTDNTPPISPVGDEAVKTSETSETNETSENKPLLFADIPKDKSEPFTDGFDEFWKVYTKRRRIEKQSALATWKRLCPDDELQAVIIRDLEKRERSEKWVEGNYKFVPYPERYLKKRKWEDEEPQTGDELKFLN